MVVPSNQVAGPAAAALESLSPDAIAFIRSLPKAELHAHLNGCIPISALQDLARQYESNAKPFSSTLSSDTVQAGIKKLQDGVQLNKIDDFFGLFPSIYALTSSPESLSSVTRAVLSSYLDGETPQCQYLELRSTPRHTDYLTRESYVRTILQELEKYPPERAALIVSLDRKMDKETMDECVNVAIKLRQEGRRVVGLDLCGDPWTGDVNTFGRYFQKAKEGGLKVTLHIAETIENPHEETLKLLSYKPDRLGHATFLNDETITEVIKAGTAIEICLSSNLLCKTVGTLEAHHIHQYLKHNHPIAICTDDTLPFRTSLVAEYALLLAERPLGLGLSREDVAKIAEMSLAHRFR